MMSRIEDDSLSSWHAHQQQQRVLLAGAGGAWQRSGVVADDMQATGSVANTLADVGWQNFPGW